MKKMMTVVLSALLSISVCGCGQSGSVQDSETEDIASEAAEAEEPVTQQEELIDDPAWDTLESMGMIETENGLFYVSITLPAELAGEDVTQESIDAKAGDTYTSGKLNEDGSVTYKMTKKQHKTMLEELGKSIEEGLQELCDSDDYAIAEITHNPDFTSFDVHLTTEDVGMAESFMVLGFYMYGGMYSLFSGKKDSIIVNYYSVNGDLIQTADSANAGN
ncbi:MAG: hypothetical protein IKR11_07620 [Solobacterium sp.]|nr:hypothetical protein [Solobacterium sp.]